MPIGWRVEWYLRPASPAVQTRAEIGTAGPEVLSCKSSVHYALLAGSCNDRQTSDTAGVRLPLSLLFELFQHKIGFVPLANPFKLRRLIPFLVGVLLVFLQPLFSLGAERGRDDVADEPSDYLVDFWGTEQGLPNNTVTGIVQTPDGYLWCGTYDGTVRFDGVRFFRIGPDDSTNREVNRVQCLHVDHRGQLWIGTDGAGLWRYADGVSTAFLDRAGSPRNLIRSIAEDRSGSLWLGTQG